MVLRECNNKEFRRFKRHQERLILYFGMLLSGKNQEILRFSVEKTGQAAIKDDFCIWLIPRVVLARLS